MKKTILMSIMLFGLLTLLSACQTRHEVALAPVEIKPIHITIDINLKIDKDLDDFFDDIDKEEEKLEESAAE